MGVSLSAGARRSEKTRWFALSTQAAAARAEISRKLTFHDLRRTYGAMLIEAGVDIYTVSRLLGHADVRITQEVYAPLCGRFMAEQAAKLGRHIGRALVRELPAIPSLKNAAESVDQEESRQRHANEPDAEKRRWRKSQKSSIKS